MDTKLEFLNSQKPHSLNLGTSFKRKPSSAFHTLRYDFKPASVDKTNVGCIEVGEGNEVTVTLPHVAGSKTSCTVYKGSKKPVQKECILIYDNRTGEFTLERISSQLQVKKTRMAGNLPQNTTVLPPVQKMPKLMSSKKQAKPQSSRAPKRDTSPTEAVIPPPSKPAMMPPISPPLPSSNDNNSDEHVLDADSHSKVSEDMLNAINSQDDSGSSSSGSSDSSSSSSSESDEEVAETNQAGEFSQKDLVEEIAKYYLPSGNLQNDLLLSDSGSDSD